MTVFMRYWRYGVASVAIVIALVAVRVWTNTLGISAPVAVRDVVTLSLGVVIEAAPFVVLGVLLSVAVRVWLPDSILQRYLPKHAGLRRVCISLFGVFAPVCECGNVPLARGLLSKGFKPSESLVFLLAAPILNPVTIITTWQAFSGDLRIVGWRIAAGFMIANLVGWIYAKAPREALLRPSFIKSCEMDRVHRSRKSVVALGLFRSELNAMIPALLIGSVVAGLVQVFVPRDMLIALGSHPVWSILAMSLLAFVVSMCSSVDAFFALAFRHTFSTGSIVSFLTFGPMIDIKMLQLMSTTYKTKILVQVSGLVLLATLLIGLAVNYVA